jgi:hypothetical protein
MLLNVWWCENEWDKTWKHLEYIYDWAILAFIVATTTETTTWRRLTDFRGKAKIALLPVNKGYFMLVVWKRTRWNYTALRKASVEALKLINSPTSNHWPHQRTNVYSQVIKGYYWCVDVLPYPRAVKNWTERGLGLAMIWRALPPWVKDSISYCWQTSGISETSQGWRKVQC